MATVKFALWDFLGTIPDPRASSGRRYSLQSVFGIIIAGILSGRNSLRSIARWARSMEEDDLKLLGINRKKAPSQTAMHDLLVRLDNKLMEKALSAWLINFIDENKLVQIAIDGKILTGSKTDEYPALHLLAAYCTEISSVIMQTAVDSKHNEITAAKEMLFKLPLKGKLVTGDAIFCQKEICDTILKNEGDYMFTVKNNQKHLRSDIKEVFKKPSSPLYC